MNMINRNSLFHLSTSCIYKPLLTPRALYLSQGREHHLRFHLASLGFSMPNGHFDCRGQELNHWASELHALQNLYYGTKQNRALWHPISLKYAVSIAKIQPSTLTGKYTLQFPHLQHVMPELKTKQIFIQTCLLLSLGSGVKWWLIYQSMWSTLQLCMLM